MILYVCERNASNVLIPVRLIDNAVSVIWIRRFNEAGEFEIYMNADAEILSLFTSEKYIFRDGDDTVMVSEKVSLTTSSEEGNYITISGHSAEIILGRRVVNRQMSWRSGTVEYIMRSIVTSQFIQTDNSRKITWITLGDERDLPEVISTKQITGTNCLTAISEIAKTYNYGFRLKWDRENEILKFDVYKGTDRTVSQNNQAAVIFSPDFENLANSSYTKSSEKTYNVAYVAGQGEGGNRTIVYTPSTDTAEGINRRELWVDARNVSSAGTPMSQDEYQDALRSYGDDKLAEARESANFSGQIITDNTFVFGEDYYLGDKVLVENGYGISGSAYVTEVTEVEDQEGYRMYPTLSNYQTT